jgi:hypothetical protein
MLWFVMSGVVSDEHVTVEGCSVNIFEVFTKGINYVG